MTTDTNETLLTNAEVVDKIDRLSGLLEKQNQLLEQQVKSQTTFRSRVLAGLWTGFGTVLGATVMISLLVLVLKPLANVRWISPIVQDVIQDLETRNPTKPNR